MYLNLDRIKEVKSKRAEIQLKISNLMAHEKDCDGNNKDVIYLFKQIWTKTGRPGFSDIWKWLCFSQNSWTIYVNKSKRKKNRLFMKSFLIRLITG